MVLFDHVLWGSKANHGTRQQYIGLALSSDTVQQKIMSSSVGTRQNSLIKIAVKQIVLVKVDSNKNFNLGT